MVTHRGFSAWICSAGQRLSEYEVAIDTNTNKAFCWIPCTSGEQFSVHWEDLGSGIDSASFITLDGYTVPGQFLYGSGTAQRSGVRSSPNTERPFMFTQVHSDARERTKELGTIVLKIKQVRRTSLAHPPNVPQTLPPASRGMAHTGAGMSVGYGWQQSTDAQFPTTWSCEPYDPQQPGYFVTFCFRYRPKEFLISQGIMFSDTNPLPTAGRQPAGLLTPETDHRPTTHHISLPSLRPMSMPMNRQSSYTYGSISMASTPESSNSSLSDHRHHPYARPASATGFQKASTSPSTLRAPQSEGRHEYAVSESVVSLKGRRISGGRRKAH